MKIEGKRVYAAEAESLWALLHDPVTLSRILPGCDHLEAIGPDEYQIRLSVRVGQAVEYLDGLLRLVPVTPLQMIDFRAEGTSADRSASVSCRGRITIDRPADNLAGLSYEADITPGGRLSSVSQRLLQTTARAFARRCLEGMEKQVAVRTRVYTTTTISPSIVATAPTGDSIHRVAQARRWLTLTGLLVIGLALWRSIDRRRTREITTQVLEVLSEAADASANVETVAPSNRSAA